MEQPLLEVSDLRVYYRSIRGEYKVVDGVDLTVHRNEIFGIAGESGCGKSTLVEGILRLVRPPGYMPTGRATFHLLDWGTNNQVDLLRLTADELREMRWKHLSYIPQGSMNSLNPVMRVEDQLLDAILFHSDMAREAARQRAREVLSMVGLPERVARSYPHELSGGMKQRVCIAMAITLQPQLIVADEPTTALDVNVQRAILEAIANIKAETGATIIFVSHDMGVHAELVDRLAIMYAGKVMEVANVYDAFDDPLHPYSQRLIASIPALGGQRVRLEGIPGLAPSPLAWPSGCRFHPRCPRAMEICKQVDPPLIAVAPGRQVACHLYSATPV